MNLIRDPKNWMLPLTLLSFSGATISFLSPIFDSTTRWLFTFVLFVALLGRYRFFGLFQIRFFQIVVLNITWGALTIIWSEVPLLSFMKIGACILTVSTFYYAAKLWVVTHNIDQSIDFLWLVVLFNILAAVLGVGESSAVIQSGNSHLYQGLTGNPNMMGSLLLMCVPLVLWKCYYHWPNMVKRILWLAIMAVVIIFLLKANSRTAITGSLICIVSLFYSFGYRKWVPSLVTLLVVIATAILISPIIYERAVEQYIYKNASKEQGVLYTRETVWEESYRLAMLGGWTGGGYGVTIGDKNFQGGLNAMGYGREKGNSQLAIMEELGIIGLALYILLIGSLYKYLISTFFLCRHKKLKVLLGISIGIISGSLFQSIFEAWWVAPGSPEFVFFWSMVGLGIGICQLVYKHLDYLEKTKKEQLENA